MSASVKNPTLQCYLLLALLVLLPAKQLEAQPPAFTEGKPAGLILENQRLPYIFWAELKTGFLHLLKRTATGNYLKQKTVSISIGKSGFGKRVEGDKKTPVGVYQLTSFLTDEQLSDFYGFGAYPLNYPNIWDRLSKRTGHGIWMHGLPKGTLDRPMLDSDGCLIVDNETLEQFTSNITTGESLLVLSEKLDWVAPDSVQPSADVLDAIDEWRGDWVDNDTPAYLTHYHKEFTDTRRNLEQWK